MIEAGAMGNMVAVRISTVPGKIVVRIMPLASKMGILTKKTTRQTTKTFYHLAGSGTQATFMWYSGTATLALRELKRRDKCKRN